MPDDWDEEWGEDGLDAGDWEDEAAGDEEDSTETVTCPSCGAEVYEDAEQCPVCGDYIVADTSVWSGRPLWWIALALAGTIAAVLILAGLARV